MSLASFVTGLRMVTWAHAQDVADALALPSLVSERLRHVCHVGVGARFSAFSVYEVVDDGAPVRVELTGVGGGVWGTKDATDRITGTALDFGLLDTQRRHRSDVNVEIFGHTADQWMSIAQTYAGAAGPGRKPLP